MGDRTSYTISVAGIDPAYYPKIEAYLADDWGAEPEWQEPGQPPAWTGCWEISELSVDETTSIADGLERLMVELDEAFAYRVDQDPMGAGDGLWYGWIPGVGYANGGMGDEQHVSVAEIDRIIDLWSTGNTGMAKSWRALAARLEELTHRQWRRAWDALDAGEVAR